MRSDRRLDQDLPGLLAELGLEPTPEYRDIVVQRTAQTRQRPAWTFPERWVPMNAATRRAVVVPMRWLWLAVLLLVVIALIAGLALIAGRQVPRRPLAPPYGPAANGAIVFDSGGDLYVRDAVTGRSRALVTGPAVDHDARYSKSGDRLVFLRKSGAGDALMIANADGSGVRQLGSGPFLNVTNGDWSADGRTIVIVSDLGDRHGMSIIDVDRGDVRQLDMPLDVEDPNFVPPVDSEVSFSMGSGTWEAATDGTDIHWLAPGDAVRYAPDGTALVYNVYDKTADGLDRTQVHVIDVATGRDRTLPNPAGVQYQGTARWSPDGTRLLLERAYADGHLRFVVVPVDGTGPQIELPYQVILGFGDLAWSPNGQQLLLGSGSQWEDDVIVDLASGAMTSVPGWVRPSWQRDAL